MELIAAYAQAPSVKLLAQRFAIHRNTLPPFSTDMSYNRAGGGDHTTPPGLASVLRAGVVGAA
jgi:hypothetical protein